MNKDLILNDENTNEDLAVSSLVTFLVHETPSLESLSRDQLKIIARSYVLDTLKDDLKRRVELEGINYTEKKATFLKRYDKKSTDTGKAYATALETLEAWVERKGLNFLDLKFKDADAFIDSLEGSSSTIRLRIAACSSFFSFLERETEGRVSNPFRGTKQRPKKKTKAPEVPTLEELETIMAVLSPSNRAAVIAMMEHGFRIGALPTLVIWGGRYSGTSKGKDILGIISSKTVEAIRAAGLDSRKPWAELSDDAIRNAFKYASMRLFKAGKINAPYSVHDIRHYFAIQEYVMNKDIYALKALLNHASIQVTETYLKGIEAYWKLK